MSAERLVNENTTSLRAAVESMKIDIKNEGGSLNYLQHIQEKLAATTDGHAQISQMIRVAQFVTDKAPDNFDEEVQSMYHGQLVGLTLAHTILDTSDMPVNGGLAHSFLNERMVLSRNLTQGVESEEQRKRRHSELAQDIRSVLTPYDESDTLDPYYADFGTSIALMTTNNIIEESYFMSGYRMVIGQAMDSLSQKIIFQGKRTDARPARKSNPEIKKRNKDEWEDITSSSKVLYKFYEHLQHDDLELASLQSMNDIEDHIEARLAEFNERHELIGPKDKLTIIGDYFAAATNEDGQEKTLLFDQNINIKGKFDGIHLIKVPTKRRLEFAIQQPDEVTKITEGNTILTPAIRIQNPYYTADLNNGEIAYRHLKGTTIDVPLNYQSVRISRAKS